MKELQSTLPVLFNLMVALGGYEGCITPVLREMAARAESPFSNQIVPAALTVSEDSDELKSLCFFPTMPILRRRRSYESDSSKKIAVCTKRHTSHQSLTPGAFTLLCQHGMS